MGSWESDVTEWLHFLFSFLQSMKVKGQKKIFCENCNQNWVEVTILRQTYCKSKTITMRQIRSFYSDEMDSSSGIYNNFNYMCTQQQSTYLYRAVIDRSEREAHSRTIVIRDFKISLSIMDKVSRQKTDKERVDINVTDQIDLTVTGHFMQ